MPDKDIRWVQRFNNFKKAMNLLSKAIDQYNSEVEMDIIEKAGMTQFFEMTYELAWNTIKDFYENEGEVNIQGSRDAFRLAFKRGLIKDGKIWMDMVKDRITTVHMYDEAKANEVINKIVHTHYPLFLQLQTRLTLEEQNKPTD